MYHRSPIGAARQSVSVHTLLQPAAACWCTAGDSPTIGEFRGTDSRANVLIQQVKWQLIDRSRMTIGGRDSPFIRCSLLAHWLGLCLRDALRRLHCPSACAMALRLMIIGSDQAGAEGGRDAVGLQ